MIPAVKSRRGMTLAELMVSLALVAVMITVVVSFVMLLTGHTQSNGQRLAFQQDFTAVKVCVEGWMTQTAGSALSTDEKSVTAGEENVLQFKNGVLSGGGFTLRTESIEAVTFQLEGENGEYLLFCQVTPADGGESYTFCVNPRVGEMVGAP